MPGCINHTPGQAPRPGGDDQHKMDSIVFGAFVIVVGGVYCLFERERKNTKLDG